MYGKRGSKPPLRTLSQEILPVVREVILRTALAAQRLPFRDLLQVVQGARDAPVARAIESVEGDGSASIHTAVHLGTLQDRLAVNIDDARGHYALNHHKRKQVCAFHDYGIFDNSSELEDEANRFVAEYLLEDDRTLETLREQRDFFTAAACLHVPKEILDYKMRMLRYYELLTKECPIYTRRDCMGRIDCSGIEGDDYA